MCCCIEITASQRLPIALVLQLCGPMNDGHDAICNMELLIIFFDGASTGLGHSLDCCRLNERGIIALHVMILRFTVLFVLLIINEAVHVAV